MTYREDAKAFRKEAKWTFWSFLPLTLIVVVVLFVVGFGLKSLGFWGGTVVERKVFEQSYQRSEALKAQIATDEASIAEIEAKLTNPNLDEDTRYNLEAQLSAARIRIETTRRKQ